MILRFKFSNYRSFRDDAELTTLATRLDEDAAIHVSVSNETDESVKALPVIAILGANASGKSNLIGAMSFMREMVISSAVGRNPLQGINQDPFRLDPLTVKKYSLFEVDFTHRGDRYVYGFEQNAHGLISGEWLHGFPHRRAQLLFDRDGSEFSFGRNLQGSNKRIADLTRPNALFLSVAANSNHDLLTEIYSWFYHGFQPVDLSERADTNALGKMIQGQERRVSQLLQLADLGILDASVEKRALDEDRRRTLRAMLERDFDDKVPDREARIDETLERLDARLDVRLAHRSRQGRTTMLSFNDESLGTRTWLLLVIKVLESLKLGSTIFVDELDASLHPALMAEILRMFSDSKSNRRGAQLIFTTHDTWTLGTHGGDSLSRGQVWFVEKDIHGASSLVPLSEYKPRKGENIGRGYLQGRYGGVPRPQSDRLLEVVSSGEVERGS